MTKSIPKLNAQILEEASAWFVDFNEEEVDQTGREEFIAWLRRSPEHVRAFLQVSAFWEDADALGERPDLDIEGVVARAMANHNVFALTAADRASAAITSEQSAASSSSDASARQRSRSRRWWFATAASISTLLGIGTVVWYGGYRGTTYATEIGEQRSITLEDGSSVELNSRSRIKVRFTKAQRSVDLLEGQALFTVAKNPARPFIVVTGDSYVRAVGTQFDVYRKHSGTVVTVVEGRVAVAPNRMKELASAGAGSDIAAGTPALHAKEVGPGVRPGEILLAAGEQTRITPVAIELPKPANIDIITAWTDKKLIFEATPLREVVEEFNRYNRQQLIIHDPDLYDFHVSGVFPSTDPSLMVEFLRQRFDVTLNRSRDEIEIFRRERASDLPH